MVSKLSLVVFKYKLESRIASYKQEGRWTRIFDTCIVP